MTSVTTATQCSANTWAGTRTVDQQVAAGRMWAAIGELAAVIGVPAAALVGTIERYNINCRDGIDRDHAKAAKFLRPVATPPFYAAL